MSVRVPRLSYEDVRRSADAFLGEHHSSRSIPIPIEEIVEFRLGLNIIPLPGLHAAFDLDGFLSADMREISVDLAVFESRPARYRFTLAHETGHLILHGGPLKTATPGSIADWKRFVRDLAESERQSMEWQAYSFAGLVLVPREPLHEAYRAARRAADEAGIDIETNVDVARYYVSTSIAQAFGVSAGVIDRRLVREGIFPRNTTMG